MALGRPLWEPNWTLRMPGHPYDGDDPDGFLPRDEIVAYLERYAAAIEAPVQKGVDVTAVRRAASGLALETSSGAIDADAVVLATGAYQRPHRPAAAATLPADLPQLDVEGYRSPAEMAAWGDDRYAQLMGLVDKLVAERDLPPVDLPPLEPFAADAPEELDLTGFGAVVFTCGFRPDHASWVHCPEAFDELGFPVHEEGACVAADGLHFIGVHFLRKRKSSTFLGIGEDAAVVAARVATRADRAA